MSHTLVRISDVTRDGIRDVDARTLHAHRGDAHLIDVREPEEFTGELGHIPGATSVPMQTIAREVEAHRWEVSDAIVVVCRSGARSSKVARQLMELGFQRVINLRGGMLGWVDACLPVE